MADAKKMVEELLAEADIRLNGERPWDMQVHNDQLYGRLLKEGTLGLGESYMDGWWEAEELDEFFRRGFEAGLQYRAPIPRSPSLLWFYVKSFLFNRQKKGRSYKVGERHYDTGNDLFEVMLDERMTYTCGYWIDGAETLDEAQERKLEVVCRSLGLERGHRVLDIGCGWGSFARFAAERCGAEVVGVTVSREQAEEARGRCEGLPVEIRLQDYRDVDEPFDRVVSLGMFEHVGHKNYRTYFNVVDRCLADDGVFVLHTIGANSSRYNTDPWIEKYIFPNSMIPSMRQIASAMEGTFGVEEWKNYGPHYDRTLMAWYHNFREGWEELEENYSERFYRMWEYYLLASAGSFRARRNNQWHIVLTKRGHS